VFLSEGKEYDLGLNRKTKNSSKRPDFFCKVDEISILNSEIKPLGVTPLQKAKDVVKGQLKAKKSINQLIESKGGPTEAALLLNAGMHT
jgi:hypothetical protein